jgi:hypothetical protein
MRDFRDAKAMARSLRDALKAKAVQTTHSESLELIAKVFGYESWNVLSAKIDAAEPRAGARRGAQSLALQRIETMLASRENASAANDEVMLSSSFARLKNKTSDELLAMKTFSQDQLKRYEQALRTAAPIINGRTR